MNQLDLIAARVRGIPVKPRGSLPVSLTDTIPADEKIDGNTELASRLAAQEFIEFLHEGELVGNPLKHLGITARNWPDIEKEYNSRERNKPGDPQAFALIKRFAEAGRLKVLQKISAQLDVVDLFCEKYGDWFVDYTPNYTVEELLGENTEILSGKYKDIQATIDFFFEHYPQFHANYTKLNEVTGKAATVAHANGNMIYSQEPESVISKHFGFIFQSGNRVQELAAANRKMEDRILFAETITLNTGVAEPGLSLAGRILSKLPETPRKAVTSFVKSVAPDRPVPPLEPMSDDEKTPFMLAQIDRLNDRLNDFFETEEEKQHPSFRQDTASDAQAIRRVYDISQIAVWCVEDRRNRARIKEYCDLEKLTPPEAFRQILSGIETAYDNCPKTADTMAEKRMHVNAELDSFLNHSLANSKKGEHALAAEHKKDHGKA